MPSIERIGGRRMTGKILSYSAGSTSRDPYKFRVINQASPPTKLRSLIETFDELAPFFANPNNALVVDGYPAALGGLDSMTRVVTYLHPPTCARALELAALEDWRAVFIAQPLAGAHLLLSAIEQGIQWPREVLWATGGYPLPASLESLISQSLIDQNCDLTVMQAYGIAELDHTLLAATQRDTQGRPIYHRIDDELTFESGLHERAESSNPFVSLRYKGKLFTNQDLVKPSGSTYRLGGNPTRYDERVVEWLESWQSRDWERFTGYLRVRSIDNERCLTLQRRHRLSVAGRIGPIENELSEIASAAIPQGWVIREMNHFVFAEHFGMSWQEKPGWSDQPIKQHEALAELSEFAAAA